MFSSLCDFEDCSADDDGDDQVQIYLRIGPPPVWMILFYQDYQDCVADDDGDGQVQANCEWDGVMTRGDFLAAGIDILK